MLLFMHIGVRNRKQQPQASQQVTSSTWARRYVAISSSVLGSDIFDILSKRLSNAICDYGKYYYSKDTDQYIKVTNSSRAIHF